MTTNLYTVPSDPQAPTPVTFERIAKVVESLGTSLKMMDEDGMGLADFSGVPIMFSFTSAGKFLSIRTTWSPDLPVRLQTMTTMFIASDEWNRERHFPTIYTLMHEDVIEVVADFICGVGAGMNDEQLEANISAGVATSIDGIQYMKHAAQPLSQL